MEEIRPKQWAIVKLRELCQKSSSVDPNKTPNKEFGYIDVSGVSNISFSVEEIKQMKGAEAPSRARKLVFTNDILFATVRPALRRVALIPPRLDGSVCSTGYCVVRPRAAVLDSRFAYYFLLSEAVLERVSALQQGAAYPAIKDSELLEIEIPLPPLEEQKTIACVLQGVQKAIQTRRRELVLERERRAALLGFMLSNGVRGEAMQSTIAGEMPQKWRVERLGDLIADGPQNGIYKHSDAYGEGTPILRINDFDNDGRFVSPKLQEVLLEESEIEKYGLVEKDIVINRVNSLSHLGKTVLTTPAVAGAVFESNMMRIRLDEAAVVPEFVAGFLLSDSARTHFRARAKRAVAQSSINQSDLKSLLVPVPPMDEQREIAEIIATCDQKAVVLNREIALQEALFFALIDDLMTGRRSVLPRLATNFEVAA